MCIYTGMTIPDSDERLVMIHVTRKGLIGIHLFEKSSWNIIVRLKFLNEHFAFISQREN